LADTLDVLTLTEAKTALRITGASHDTELAAWITLHQSPSGALFLYQPPVVSITNVKEWASGTATTLTAEANDTAGGYRYDSRLGTISRRSSWYDTTWSSDYVTVTYVAGRAATTAAVDPLFKQAAAIILTHLWRSSGTGRGEVFDAVDGSNVFGTPPFSIPRAAVELLGGEVRAPAIA
jgi:hypothetical protein